MTKIENMIQQAVEAQEKSAGAHPERSTAAPDQASMPAAVVLPPEQLELLPQAAAGSLGEDQNLLLASLDRVDTLDLLGDDDDREEEAQEVRAQERDGQPSMEDAEEASEREASSPEGSGAVAEESATAEASAAGSAAPSAAAASGLGGVSPWVWGGLAAAGAGGALLAGSDDGEDALLPPSLSLQTDTGPQDGVTREAVVQVSGLEAGARWEYSLDGGSNWIDGSGSTFTLDEEGTYQVVARQFRGTEPSPASAALSITIDQTDPTATGPQPITVDENTAAGTALGEVLGEDSGSAVSYALGENSDEGLSINASTGVLSFAVAPDHETKASYQAEVVVSDQAGNSVVVPVAISVTDLDDTAPIVTSPAEATALDENSAAGQVVYQAVADDSADISEGFSFSLADNGDELFSIDAVTGVVTLNISPDHETQASYSFRVLATDVAGNVGEKLVELAINDLDEVAPTFTSAESVAAVDENSDAGQVIYAAEVDDSQDISGGVVFSLSADSDPGLRINASSGEVSLISSPDFEERASYSFTVVAEDLAGNRTERALELVINDVDDNNPVFTSGVVASLQENTAAGAPVYTAQANADEGVVGPLVYGITVAEEGLFTIDAATGAVTSLFSPDFETREEYQFVVTATDSNDAVSARTVVLSVGNVDDTAPQFTSGAAANVNENEALETVVYAAVADDSADVSAGLTYSLKAGSDDALSIDVATGAVRLTAIADHEAQTSYNFTVVARDGSDNVAEQAIVLTVIDLDEVAPTFLSGAVADAIEENTDAGQAVYTAQVDDSADVSGGVTFSLKVGSDDAVSIDGASGVVTLNDAPDFEAQDAYAFTVVATDAAGNRTEQAVGLEIIDLDEIPPTALALAASSETNTAAITFDEPLDEAVAPAPGDFAVVQGGVRLAVTGVEVQGAVVTLSFDGGVNPGPIQVTYTAPAEGGIADLAGNVAGSFLQMVVSDGYIRGAKIYADVNGDGVAQESELIEGATTDRFGQIILDGTELSAPLLIVGGVNTDTGAKNSIVLKTGAGSTVANPLTTLVETVAASGGTREEAEATVLRGLGLELPEGTSLAEYDPLSDQSEASLASRKAVATIASIIAVAANASGSDDTSAVASQVAARIAAQVVEAAQAPEPAAVDFSGDVLTEILKDETTGESLVAAEELTQVTDAVATIKTAESVDVVVQQQARVSDRVAPAAPLLGLTTETDTGVSDSDNLTNIVDQQLSLTIEVDATDGTALIAGDTVELLQNGEVLQTVVVTEAHLAAGEITLALGVLPEGISSFSAQSTDRAGNVTALPSGVSIEIDTTAPEISSSAQAAALDENSAAGTAVYTVTASDSNDASRALSYALKEGGDGAAFSIDAATGVVSIVASPDHETKASYSFTVVATDAAGNASEKAVTLSINDLDEADPTITSGATATAIDENSGEGQVIYTATATDTDDVSGGVTFSLKAGSDAGLSIDKDTGKVTLAASPDHETKASYSFTVVATDAAGNASEQAVTLPINDLDEADPTITSGATATAIDENSGEGQVIYTATATDTDDVSGGVTFSLKAGSDAGLSIDKDTGKVTLAASPDHETKASYSFTVVATDAADNASEKAVTLSINDLDEADPTITSGATATAIDENSGEGQVIYTATATDTDDVSGGVTFSLKAGSDAGLSIDKDTGKVTLAASPDHETKASYSFTVVATDAADNASEKAVTLSINDLDEADPTITSGATATAIDENSGEGQVIYTATATDTDDVSGGVTFSLKAGSDAGLSIDKDTGKVTLAASPDHETKASYSFTVVATDAADNASEQAVTLTINDLDEADPTITSGATAAAIDENSGEGQVIYTATATDTDDVSGGVTFSLKAGSDAGLSIDKDAGKVTLAASPDHETKASYSFTVVATDAADNESEKAVTLSINDLDEADPTITSDATATAIDENSGEGQVIYTATATDTDDVSGGVTFSLKAGSDAGLSIDKDTGKVTLAASPDHETKSSYSFTVVATDAADNATEKAVTLTINDLDEADPTITSGATATAIDENSGSGQVIYTASATDVADIDDSTDLSSTLEFTLKAGSDEGLSINKSTGAVTLAGSPDYETKTSYSFTVVATDAAGNATEKAVTLSINDLDEADPTITSGAAATAIDENSGEGQVIYTATATDTDDVSGGVTFSLKAGSDAGLSIDKDTGAVTLAASPDHETKASYSFTVVATDAADNATEKAVTLSINDLDEADPTITSGATATAIDENSGEGQVVYTAVATDAADVDDAADASSSIEYSLKAGSDAGLSINKDTGEVTLAASPDHETKASYSFTVVATDAAGNASEKAVALTVNDLDEAGPTITSGATATAIDENSGSGQVIYTATATDVADIDDSTDLSSALEFSLKAGSDEGVSINKSTGAVTLASPPDHEAKASYSFTVVATDAAGNSGEQAVTLSINDLDDTAPAFTSSAVASIGSRTPLIYEAVASDAADVSSGTLEYGLEGGNEDDAALLSIDAETGVVFLQESVTGQANKGSYSFTVTASDGINPVASQVVTVTVAPEVLVAGPGVIDQGGIVLTPTVNESGTITISATISEEEISNFAAGLDTLQLDLNFDPSVVEAVSRTDVILNPGLAGFSSINDESASQGLLVIAGGSLSGITVDATTELFSLTLTPLSDALIDLSVTDIKLNSEKPALTEITVGSVPTIDGTSDPNTFVLDGGQAQLSLGEGPETIIIGVDTTDGVTVSGFESGVDVIDVSELLLLAGYSDIKSSDSVLDGVVGKYPSIDSSALDLVGSNSLELDNVFGLLETDAGVLGFLDQNPLAGAVSIVSVEIVSADAFELTDLRAVLDGFIA